MGSVNTNSSSFQDFEGDDFSNNLIADLGPLLALFGADVTRQFLSQSLSWTDNILFAIGPLGVVTAVISAIRVGAPQSLRSFIGRAREPRAQVEAELLSSTSKEVCEMWNGTSLVRLRGSSNVVELVVAFTPEGTRPPEDKNFGLHLKESDDKNRVIETQQHKNKSDNKKNKNEKQIVNDAGIEDDVESSGSVTQGSTTQPLTPGLGSPGPNLSLNYLPSPGSIELTAFSVIAVILQVAVLFLDALITYRLKWLKSGKPVAPTACPFVMIGTLLLFLGMGTCSVVIQGSTRETWFRVTDGTDAKVLWIQRQSVVDDQHFGSYAIFAPGSMRDIVSSTREPHFQADNPVAMNHDQGFTVRMLAFKATTICAVVASVVGYIIQFIGFRQMHWLATILQLALAIIMTAIRAYVRRNLSRRPLHHALPVGHELDWLATRKGLYKQLLPDEQSDMGTLTTDRDAKYPKLAIARTLLSPIIGNVKESRRLPFSSFGELVLWVNKKPEKPWCGEDKDGIDWFVAVPRANSQEDSLATGDTSATNVEDHRPSSRLDAQAVLRVRCRLTDLAQWDLSEKPEWITFQSIVSSLADAIGGVMDCLYEPDLFNLDVAFKNKSLFEWVIYVGRDKQEVKLQVNRQAGKWTADKSELEAVLSLWTYSLNLDGHDEYARDEKLSRINDIENVILTGQNLVRDAKWWIPGGPWNIGNDSSSLKYSFSPVETSYPGDKITRLCVWQLFAQFTRCVTKGIHTVCGLSTASVLQAADNVQALETILRRRMEDSIELSNPSICRLFDIIWSSGLCSKVQASLAIIPPLSEYGKLPHPDSVVDKVLSLGRSFQKREMWERSAKLYSSLIKTCESFGQTSRVLLKALAVVTEYLSVLECVIDLYEMRADEKRIAQVQSSITLMREAQTQCGQKAVQRVREYRELQCSQVPGDDPINWHDFEDCIPNKAFRLMLKHGSQYVELMHALMEMSEISRMVNEQDIFGWTLLHHYASGRKSSRNNPRFRRDDFSGATLIRAGADPNAKDLSGHTPLHHAALSQDAESINFLIQFGVDMNARDAMGKTAMHHAARFMDRSLVSALYEKGADIDARDHFGLTPIHDAALMGNMDVVLFLIKAQANTRTRESSGMAPVHFVCGQTRCDAPEIGEVLQLFQRSGVDSFSSRDQEGRTALHHAAKSGCLNAIRSISLDRDPQTLHINAEDQARRTPFHWAVKKDKLKALQEMAEHFTPDCRSRPWLKSPSPQDKWGYGLLHIAVQSRSVHVLDYLLKMNKSLVKEVDSSQATALHLRETDESIARRLVASGADIDARDSHGRKPIHCAQGPRLISFLLREHKKNVSEWKELCYWQDVNKNTPLHVAFRSHCGLDSIAALADNLPRFLIDVQGKEVGTPLHLLAGRNYVNATVPTDVMPKLRTPVSERAKDPAGRTPLGVAICKGTETTVRLFLDHGFQPDAETSLHHAIERGNVNIVNMLLEKLDASAMDFISQDSGMTPLHIAVK